MLRSLPKKIVNIRFHKVFTIIYHLIRKSLYIKLIQMPHYNLIRMQVMLMDSLRLQQRAFSPITVPPTNTKITMSQSSKIPEQDQICKIIQIIIIFAKIGMF